MEVGWLEILGSVLTIASTLAVWWFRDRKKAEREAENREQEEREKNEEKSEDLRDKNEEINSGIKKNEEAARRWDPS